MKRHRINKQRAARIERLGAGGWRVGGRERDRVILLHGGGGGRVARGVLGERTVEKDEAPEVGQKTREPA